MAILVKQGSVGEPVKQLQTMLNFVVGPPLLVVDGIFGPKTRAHTVQFQQQAKLVADAIVGPLTAKALMTASLMKLMGS
jgi:peptidoglycan hydrolase-like protein with peptidoglycan-binding domain